MPDATLILNAEGAYFCDHGGSGKEVLGEVTSAVLAHAPDVRVEPF